MYDNASLNAKIEKLNAQVLASKKTVDELNAEIEKYKGEAKVMNERHNELVEKIKKNGEMEEKVRIASAKEAKIKDVISRVESVYESFECNLTCLLCGEISQKCTVCIPCGHCFCEKCITGGKHKVCPNCSAKIHDTFESKVLEEIACKFAYSKKMVDVFKDDKFWKFQ